MIFHDRLERKDLEATLGDDGLKHIGGVNAAGLDGFIEIWVDWDARRFVAIRPDDDYVPFGDYWPGES